MFRNLLVTLEHKDVGFFVFQFYRPTGKSPGCKYRIRVGRREVQDPVRDGTAVSGIRIGLLMLAVYGLCVGSGDAL